MSEPISAAEVRTGVAYDEERSTARRRLAEDRVARRVQLGDDLALVFESRSSVLAALEESLRADRVVEPEGVEAMLPAFNGLLVSKGEVAATLSIDLADPAALADRAAALADIAGALAIEVDGVRAPARPATDATPGAGAVIVVFTLEEPQRRSCAAGAAMTVVVDHAAAHARVQLSPEASAAILADLTDR